MSGCGNLEPSNPTSETLQKLRRRTALDGTRRPLKGSGEFRWKGGRTAEVAIDTRPCVLADVCS